MSLALHSELLSVEDYLRGEQDSPVKRVFIGGVVYAKAGATIR